MAASDSANMAPHRISHRVSAAGEACLRVGFAANLVLVAGKLVAGVMGQSQALIADGFNSVLDLVAGTIALIGYRVAAKPPDRDHHYGHGNAETVAALIVGLLIVATGSIIVRDAVVTIWEGTAERPAPWTVYVAVAVILLKLGLFLYSRRVAERERSLVVRATATDHLSDVIATLGVLVGVVGAQLGYPVLDPIAAFWVAAVILYHAFKIIRENTFVLLGGAPPQETIDDIVATLRSVPGVLGLHRTKVRTAGRGVIVDTEILVDGGLSIDVAHDIANTASDTVMAAYPGVVDVVVHVEPYTPEREAEGADPLTPRHRTPRPEART
jgi:cation diffusion facilitator family transporter